MKVVEFYSGTQGISNAFRHRGHTVLSIELDHKFTMEPFNLNQWTINVSDVRWQDIVKKLGGYPDVIWGSPMCTTETNMAISHHRTLIKGHGKTQSRQKRNNLLIAKSDTAIEHDKTLQDFLILLQELKPKFYFVENPMAGMRKNPLMLGLMYRYTVTYCQYGETNMKPTDLWTNHPNPQFKPMCKNGDPCHEAAPRSSKTGTQGKKDSATRSMIPKQLCEHIVDICEEYISK